MALKMAAEACSRNWVRQLTGEPEGMTLSSGLVPGEGVQGEMK